MKSPLVRLFRLRSSIPLLLASSFATSCAQSLPPSRTVVAPDASLELERRVALGSYESTLADLDAESARLLGIVTWENEHFVAATALRENADLGRVSDEPGSLAAKALFRFHRIDLGLAILDQDAAAREHATIRFRRSVPALLRHASLVGDLGLLAAMIDLDAGAVAEHREDAAPVFEFVTPFVWHRSYERTIGPLYEFATPVQRARLWSSGIAPREATWTTDSLAALGRPESPVVFEQARRAIWDGDLGRARSLFETLRALDPHHLGARVYALLLRDEAQAEADRILLRGLANPVRARRAAGVELALRTRSTDAYVLFAAHVLLESQAFPDALARALPLATSTDEAVREVARSIVEQSGTRDARTALFEGLLATDDGCGSPDLVRRVFESDLSEDESLLRRARICLARHGSVLASPRSREDHDEPRNYAERVVGTYSLLAADADLDDALRTAVRARLPLDLRVRADWYLECSRGLAAICPYARDDARGLARYDFAAIDSVGARRSLALFSQRTDAPLALETLPAAPMRLGRDVDDYFVATARTPEIAAPSFVTSRVRMLLAAARTDEARELLARVAPVLPPNERLVFGLWLTEITDHPEVEISTSFVEDRSYPSFLDAFGYATSPACDFHWDDDEDDAPSVELTDEERASRFITWFTGYQMLMSGRPEGAIPRLRLVAEVAAGDELVEVLGVLAVALHVVRDEAARDAVIARVHTLDPGGPSDTVLRLLASGDSPPAELVEDAMRRHPRAPLQEELVATRASRGAGELVPAATEAGSRVVEDYRTLICEALGGDCVREDEPGFEVGLEFQRAVDEARGASGGAAGCFSEAYSVLEASMSYGGSHGEDDGPDLPTLEESMTIVRACSALGPEVDERARLEAIAQTVLNSLDGTVDRRSRALLEAFVVASSRTEASRVDPTLTAARARVLEWLGRREEAARALLTSIAMTPVDTWVRGGTSGASFELGVFSILIGRTSSEAQNETSQAFVTALDVALLEERFDIVQAYIDALVERIERIRGDYSTRSQDGRFDFAELVVLDAAEGTLSLEERRRLIRESLVPNALAFDVSAEFAEEARSRALALMLARSPRSALALYLALLAEPTAARARALIARAPNSVAAVAHAAEVLVGLGESDEAARAVAPLIAAHPRRARLVALMARCGGGEASEEP